MNESGMVQTIAEVLTDLGMDFSDILVGDELAYEAAQAIVDRLADQGLIG